MQRFKRFFPFLIKSLSIACLSLSCSTKTLELPAYFYSTVDPEEGISDLSSKESLDQEEDSVCKNRVNEENPVCWTFPGCRSFCEELFFSKEKQQICYNWPTALVDDFEILFSTMTKGLFQNIDSKIFKCFLKLSENNSILFKNLNEEESKEFLEEVAVNHNLAYHLASEDKGNFSVLTALFRKIKSRFINAIKQPLSHKHSNFLIALHKEENRSAWTWLNDYLIYRCRGDSTCKEPLDYYCEILEDVKGEALEDFFENNGFKREYRQRIESKTCGSSRCEYGELRDFDEMCDNI